MHREKERKNVQEIKTLRWGDFHNRKASGGERYVAKLKDGTEVEIFFDHLQNARMKFEKSGYWLVDVDFDDEKPEKILECLQSAL